MKKDYGKIAVTNGGLWNEQTLFEKLTTVSRNGQGYLSFEDNQGVDPEQDCDPITGIGTKWFRIATKGDPGTTDYNELINKPFIPTALSELIADALHRTVSDTEKTTWNNKQDSISDLGTIRSGAAAGATAYQKPLGGIPASDIANGVIPDVSQFITKSVNDLVNYYTKSETYTQSEVNTLIGSIQQFHYEIYPSLQDITTPATNVLYLVGPTGSGSDKYEEYVYANNAFVKIGDTSIDLSNYVTTQALNSALQQFAQDLQTELNNYALKSQIKTVNGNSLIGSGNIDTKESFEVTYNVTPYADILAAYNAGKKIYCNYGGFLFFMTIVDSSSFYFQSGFHDYNLEMSSFYVSSTTGYSAINYQYLSQAIPDLGTIRSGAAKGATAYQKPSGGIPESDLTSELQQTIDNVPSILQSISAISDLVPEQASSSNQLADKNFVNSSIQTNTAEFKGTRNLVTDLSLTTSATQQQIAAALASAISSADNNDYCFVQIPTNDATPTQIARVDRYKYNGSAWLFEWSLNNSSFTAAQWASINSGIVGSDVTKLNALPTKTELDTLFAAKQDTLVSGTNIKTINNTSVLGSGNLTLEDSSNKTSDIANNDADTTKYPSCKGVADYVSAIVGNINSILETI